MEWDREACLKLIDEYEKAPILWDAKNGNYYSKPKKQEAWETVATKLNTDVEELKKKLNSLLGSFRRERSKHRRQVALGREYVSKWFAYEKMKFLLEIREDKEDSEYLTYAENDEESEGYLGSPGSSSLVASTMETGASVSNGSFKRPKLEEDKYIVSSVLNDRVSYMNNSNCGFDYGFDEFDALGKIVATKVRQMNANQRIFAEKLINDILYFGQLEKLSANSYIQSNYNDTGSCVLSPDDGTFS